MMWFVVVVVVTVVTAAVADVVRKVVAEAGRFVHVAALHTMPEGHALPQIPQFVVLEPSS
jgi:hypothetical protein